jgi:hypothetical protein
VVAGSGEAGAALLARSGRLARESSGVVAFLWGPSRGSVFTVREAIRADKPAAVVLAGGGAELPRFWTSPDLWAGGMAGIAVTDWAIAAPGTQEKLHGHHSLPGAAAPPR